MRSVTRACRNLLDRTTSPLGAIVTAHALVLLTGFYLMLVNPEARLPGLWMAGILAVAGGVWTFTRVGAAGLSIASLGAVSLLCGYAFMGSLLDLDARPPTQVATLYRWIGGGAFVLGLAFFSYECLRARRRTRRPTVSRAKTR